MKNKKSSKERKKTKTLKQVKKGKEVMESIIPESIEGSRSSEYNFDNEAEIVSCMIHGENVLVDKRTNDAQACIEDLKDCYKKIIYIDAKDKTPYRSRGKEFSDFLGFDYKTIKKDKVDCIIAPAYNQLAYLIGSALNKFLICSGRFCTLRI